MLLTVAPPGCLLDAGLKHRCRVDSDCANHRFCVNQTCHVSRPDGGGNDGPAEGGGDANPDGDGGAHPNSDADWPYVDAIPPGANYMFVTSGTVIPGQLSLEKADQLCNDAARAGGLPGDYRAWLSTSSIDARDRLGDARGWVRPDGAPFADTLIDILRGRILFPPLLDEQGRETRGPVVTGTHAGGFVQSTCNDWTSMGGDGNSATTGVTEGTMDLWTMNGSIDSCSVAMHLYCFGITGHASVAPIPVSGRIAFLSDGWFFSTGGAAAADSLCNDEAVAAGIAGRFVALVATTTSAAANRISVTDAPRWVRVDGVPLNQPGQDIFNTGLRLAPLNVTSRRVYLSSVVFAGARNPNVSALAWESCENWTLALNTESAQAGIASDMRSWFGGTTGDCSRYFMHVYCLEN